MRTTLAATILCILFVSCYSERKAKIALGKAVTTFPQVGQEYCAITYPPKVGTVRRDTITRRDTFYTEGTTFYDTLYSHDTVRIYKTVQLPGIRTVERITIHDTIEIENTAALELARGDSRRAITLLEAKTKEYDKWRRIAIIRFWIIIGLAAVLGGGVVWTVKRRTV